MKRKGVLVVVSGFSGAGKGTLMKLLLENHNNYALSVSATTRQPREGEVDGVSYFFKTVDEFQKMIEEDAFIEYAQYVENYYGTPKEYVLEQMEAGKDVILEIEMQGALKVKEKYPDVVLVFVTAPSVEELRRRLTDRGTEAKETVEARLLQAKAESQRMQDYDYILVNETGQEKECAEELHKIIQGAHWRIDSTREFAESIKEQFTQL